MPQPRWQRSPARSPASRLPGLPWEPREGAGPTSTKAGHCPPCSRHPVTPPLLGCAPAWPAVRAPPCFLPLLGASPPAWHPHQYLNRRRQCDRSPVCRGGQGLPSTHPYPKFMDVVKTLPGGSPRGPVALTAVPMAASAHQCRGPGTTTCFPPPIPWQPGPCSSQGPHGGRLLSSHLQLNTQELGIHAALGPRLAQEEREAREQALLVGGAGAEPGPPAPPGPLPAPTSPARDSAAGAKASLHQGPSQGWARGLEGPWGSGPAGTVPGQPPAHTPSPSCPSQGTLWQNPSLRDAAQQPGLSYGHTRGSGKADSPEGTL